MKKARAVSPTIFISFSKRRVLLSAFLLALLSIGLWMAAAPAARARVTTPVDLLQAGLPPGKTLTTATKPEFLASVCAAVKDHRNIGPEITRTAVSAHREYAADIVATVLRCSANGDCAYVARVVRAAIATAASEASIIQDAALAINPDCADAIQGGIPDGKQVLDGKEMLDGKEVLDGKEALAPPAEGPGLFTGPFNQVPLPGSVPGGGGAFNPGEQLVTVCVNGTQRSVRESQLSAFLSAHPGASAGSCQPTPTQFASVCDNGTQRSVLRSRLAGFLAAHPGDFVGSCQPTPTTNR